MIVPRQRIDNMMQYMELRTRSKRRRLPDTSGIENPRPNIEHYGGANRESEGFRFAPGCVGFRAERADVATRAHAPRAARTKRSHLS